MKSLFYCGNNCYHQCSLNVSKSPKIIYKLSFILKEHIENVQCTHRLLIFKMGDSFQIHGMINESDDQKIKIIRSPINSESYLSTDDFILIANCSEFWKSDYTDQWSKANYTWECKEEEELWKENGNEIEKLSKTNDNVYCLLGNGSVWSFDETGKLKLIYSPDLDKATDIASGFEHCLILTEGGCVLSFGTGSRGQTGHGDLNALLEPAQISALIGLKIIKIGAAGWHSCALTDSGDLYTWGWNNSGQLGFQTDDDSSSSGIGLIAEPMALDLPYDVKDVDCGTRHTVIITVSEDLYAAGWNKYGQLGIGNSSEKVDKFTKMDNDIKGNKKLICGPWCTILLVDNEK